MCDHQTTCKLVVEALVNANFLCLKSDGTYVRLTEGRSTLSRRHGSTLVVTQQSSQAPAPTYAVGRVGQGRPRHQLVVESLVIPFEMILLDKLHDRASEVPLRQRQSSD